MLKNRYICVFLVILTLSVVLVSTVHADDVVDNVVITVPESCTFSEQMPESNQYSVEIAPGHYTENIGNTTFQVFCNDNNGYSVYAVGYSGNTIGNTDLISSNVSINNIATGTTTSGTTSSWSMKMLPVTGTYAPTIENGYSAYKVVPSAYTKVATFPSITDRTAGSSFQAKYAIYAGNGQAAGTFTGKVKYTLVHPASETPLQPYDTTAGYIGYYPNASGVVDNMGDQAITSTDTSATLWPTNFKRPGYGFAGWSDQYDYQINSGTNTGHIYGPMETISFTAGQYSDADKGLSLYAVWVKSQGNLQNWSGCNSLQQGKVTALTDTRDNNTYAVAKLADGKCWMIENLRLDHTNSDNSTGTLSQGYGGQFAGLAQPETANFSNVTTANSLYNSGTGYRRPRYRNDNTNTDTTTNPNTTVANMTGTGQNIYSYGNYYTWSAALANTNDYTGPTETDGDGKTSETVNTSICPAGWRLPYGRDTGNGNTPGGFYYLNYAINNGNITNATASNKLRSYPNNFVYSGYVNGSSVNNRGSHCFYWSSTANNSNNAYYFYFYSTGVGPGTLNSSKFYGWSIRCVISPSA